MSFTTKIVLGIVAGIATGLFLGDIASPFSLGGDVFIGLLQMTVLPYIVVSLVANLGRISWNERRGMLVAAVAVLGLMLTLGLLVLTLAPFAFPEWETGAFFSTALVEPRRSFDFVGLYIPSNPFGSLANNVVPAVVLFSILMGVGVSGVPGREGLIRALDVLASALNSINKMIIRLTPIGVFAIAAGTAGTISLAELGRLQGYVVIYTVIALLLTFLILPLLVTAVTPFRYRDLLGIPKDTLITIFAAAKIIVVLPQLIDDIKELFRRYELESDEVSSGADILLPLAYPFPNLGTYTILVFVPFAAWYLGRALDPTDHLLFQGAALLSSFVAPIIGIPFLLDILHLPSDMMELFVVSTVYTDRIRVVLGAVHLISLTVVVLSVVRGVFRVDWMRLARVGGLCLLIVLASGVGVRFWLTASAGHYTADEALVQMHWMSEPTERVVIHKKVPDPDPKARKMDRLARIRERDSLRVGYRPDSLPFAFVSAANQTVGFDIELAHFLADDLDVELEIVRLEDVDMGDALADGRVDIVMSGIAMTADRIARWDFPTSPLDLTLAFLVRDDRRNELSSLRRIRRMDSFRIGVVQGPSLRRMLEKHFPNAKIETISSPRNFLRGRRDDLDAVAYSAEGGSAWTLVYPDFAVAVPSPLSLKVPAGYPLPPGNPAWQRFLSEWIRLKQKDGTIDALFEHWILGGGARSTAPRWSVIRDVLHWVD
jgi:Na+/H+-dicarboxylate symporter/ABC-type amino acid transport substrate-binding protein